MRAEVPSSSGPGSSTPDSPPSVPVLRFGVWGLKFGVWGLGFGVWVLGFEVWGLGFGV